MTINSKLSGFTNEEKICLTIAAINLGSANAEKEIQGWVRLGESIKRDNSMSFLQFMLTGLFNLVAESALDRKANREIDAKYDVEGNTTLLKRYGVLA